MNGRCVKCRERKVYQPTHFVLLFYKQRQHIEFAFWYFRISNMRRDIISIHPLTKWSMRQLYHYHFTFMFTSQCLVLTPDLEHQNFSLCLSKISQTHTDTLSCINAHRYNWMSNSSKIRAENAEIKIMVPYRESGLEYISVTLLRIRVMFCW